MQAKTSERYVSIEQAVEERSLALSQAQQLHQHVRDINDELSWLKEKERIASASELGKDLPSTANLVKGTSAVGE